MVPSGELRPTATTVTAGSENKKTEEKTHCKCCVEPRSHMFMMPFGSNSFSPLHGQFEPSLFIGPLSLSWLGNGIGFCIRVCPVACMTREATTSVHEMIAMFVSCGLKCSIFPPTPVSRYRGPFCVYMEWPRQRIVSSGCLHLVREPPTQSLEAVKVARRTTLHERGARNFLLGYGLLISAVVCCHHSPDQCEN